MIREVSKPPKVALCRECHGTGLPEGKHRRDTDTRPVSPV